MDDKDNAIKGYNGKCPICGSSDGMITLCGDGKYRNICRVCGCPAWYRPAPMEGYDTIEQARDPFTWPPIKEEHCTVDRYINGNKQEVNKNA